MKLLRKMVCPRAGSRCCSTNQLCISGATFLQAPQIKDELMEIVCADLQQAQSNSQYLRESPLKLDPAVEGVRAAERVGPQNLDGLQRRQSLQDSPKSRISTTTSSFAQAPATPSRTPAYQTSPKRGRKCNDNFPPNRARDVQRAFRARRAAHLQVRIIFQYLSRGYFF
jgi:hypothetical protein